MSEIDDLRKEVALLRRVVETLIDVPAIYLSPSFRPVLREMGYEIYSEPKKGSRLRKITPATQPSQASPTE